MAHHTPVLVEEVLEYLAIRPDGLLIDATCGLAGHTMAIAERLTTGLVVAADCDKDSLAIARENAGARADRIRWLHTSFSGLAASLAREGIGPADGLLADLGVSLYQLTDPSRGFTFQADCALDMRMDRGQSLTAADIVNFTSEKELADLLFRYGEERRAKQTARAIVRARPIRNSQHLTSVVMRAVVPRSRQIHPASKVYMALRRAVNREEEELEALLESAPSLVRPGGRIVIISFMSLEDRLVKRAFQGLARSARARILTKHVVRPSRQEVLRNAASRSARLRALEMK